MNNIEELQLIESIVEASPAIVFRWLIQEGWPVEYVSRNIENLGYTQEEMISGKVSWPGITHPDDISRLEKETEDFLANGIERWSQTYRICVPDGTHRWIQDWNRLLRDEEGVPRKVQGILIDVTKEKTAEQQQKDTQKELAKVLEKIISGFLPICAECKAIRDKSGNWIPIETYFAHKSQVQFSHGYCPDCYNKALENLDQDFPGEDKVGKGGAKPVAKISEVKD